MVRYVLVAARATVVGTVPRRALRKARPAQSLGQ